MVALAEKPPQSREVSPPPAREKDPLRHNREIEHQQDLFWDVLKSFQNALTTENLSQEVPKLVIDILEAKSSKSEIEQATTFFALATAVESLRSPSHAPTWQQAEAALHMVFPYQEGVPQRIQMATGEGKTFAIAIASLWEAAQGKFVTVHTDKYANVEQSHSKMSGLFELFQVSHGEVQDSLALGADYGKYLNGLPPHQELPKIRYGTWSQSMHEYLARQQVIFTAEAFLRGDMQVLRRGAQLSEAGRGQLQESLEYQKKMIVPGFIPVDEGDLSLDMEESPVVIASPDIELSPRERDELALAWELFDDQQPTLDGVPGTVEQIATAVQMDVEAVRQRFEVIPKVTVEGMASEDERKSITSQGVDLQWETFHLSKLLEATVVPEKLSQILKLLLLQYQDGQLVRSPLPLQNVHRLIELADASAATHQLDWAAVNEALPALNYQELRAFFSAENMVLNYQEVLRQNPELRTLLKKEQGEVTQEDLQLLKETFTDFPQLLQRIIVNRLMDVVNVVWEPMMSRYSHDILSVKYLMNEGDDYQFEEVLDDQGEAHKEAVILGPDRQPQPGKQFQGNIQAFVHLKHDMELPTPEKTIAQIMPMTWYQMMARRGAVVPSLSGTQDEPDFIVESTGTSQVEVLDTRVFENQQQKLRAIAKYVDRRKDVPILLCAQNYTEMKQLEELLRKLSGRDLVVLDAQHASEANQLVPRLEKGKILLLQITARGLDFGHLLEDGAGHSFEDGLIISANQLPDTHQQKQMEGRLGGKRPSGSVVTFTALDDGLAQELYSHSPELAQKRHEKMAELEHAYGQLKAQNNVTQWPESLAEAVMEIVTWEETHQPTDRGQPFWMRIATYSKDFQQLTTRLEDLQARHVRDLEKQQESNLHERYEARRRQMTIDVVIQNLWMTIMSPTAETPLGKVMLPLTHEQRQAVIERVFDEAAYLYPLSAQQVKEDSLASTATKERAKMAQFMKDLVDRITMWIELENMEKRYNKLVKVGSMLTDTVVLPDAVTDLSDWLKINDEREQKVPFLQQHLHGMMQNLFLGLRIYNDPTNVDSLPIPAPTPEAPQLEHRQKLFKNLREVAKQESEIRRKFQAE